MEEKTTSKGKVSVTYGLIAGTAAIAFTMVVDIMGFIGNQTVQYAWYAVAAVIIFLAHREFKVKGDGYMNYGEGVGIGTLVSLISGVLSSVFFYFYLTVINTGVIGTLLKLQEEKFVESGKYGSELEQMMEATEKFMKPMTIVILGFLFGFFFSVVLSLIMSAMTQKKRPENLA